MSRNKLNRDEVLRGILTTLVDGYGRNAVELALHSISSTNVQPSKKPAHTTPARKHRSTVPLIVDIQVDKERKILLRNLSKKFDQGIAFPELSDVRNFLISHQHDASNINDRYSAFNRMLPILTNMSGDGLKRLIARSHHSGPAELGPISDAISGAGESMRRTKVADQPRRPDDKTKRNKDNLLL